MKTPEEIKKGLECCKNDKCADCRYFDGNGYWSCVGRLIDDIFAYVQQLEAHQPRWISVKEREPEPFVSVLGYIPDEAPMPVVREGYRVSAGNCNAYYFPVLADRREITHWMEIPEPPKEG